MRMTTTYVYKESLTGAGSAPTSALGGLAGSDTTKNDKSVQVGALRCEKRGSSLRTRHGTLPQQPFVQP